MAIILCDHCGIKKEKPSFCSPKCRKQSWLDIAPSVRYVPATDARIAALEKRIETLNKLYQESEAQCQEYADEIIALKAAPQSTPLETLKEKIKEIETKPAPVQLPATRGSRTEQNADGEYLNAPGKTNPAYDYGHGYAEPAVSLD